MQNLRWVEIDRKITKHLRFLKMAELTVWSLRYSLCKSNFKLSLFSFLHIVFKVYKGNCIFITQQN